MGYDAGLASEPVWIERLEEKSFASVSDRTLVVQSVVCSQILYRLSYTSSYGMTSGKSKRWYHWMQECHEFSAKQTVHNVQDGVQRGGMCVYCQNILPN
jgi:hypothetical protein